MQESLIFLSLAVFGTPFLVIEKTCYRRLINGRRLEERFIRHSLPCDSLQACQHQCSIEKHFQCYGFNIRLDRLRAEGRGICELTAIPSGFLDPSRDFLFDPAFDFYEKDRSNLSPNCGYINEVVPAVPPRPSQEGAVGPYFGGDFNGRWGPGGGSVEPGPWGPAMYGGGPTIGSTQDPGGPFRPVGGPQPRPNPGPLTTPMFSPVGNEIPDQNRFRDKFLRKQQGRAYLPGPPPVGSYVIIDATTARPGPGRQEGPWELARALHHHHHDHFHGNDVGFFDNEVCFQRAHPGHKLDPSCVRAVGQVPHILACEEMCLNTHFRCSGYSFRYSDKPDGEPNCALTDLSEVSEFPRNLLGDRSCDVYIKMPSCVDTHGLPDTECFSKIGSSIRQQTTVIRTAALVANIADCELDCLKAGSFTCRSFTFRHGPPVIGDPRENCFLSDWPVSSLQQGDLAAAPGYQVYERGSYGHGCELDSGPPYIGPYPGVLEPPSGPRPMHPMHPPPEWVRQDTWQHFTVRGWPCRFGTACQLNREAGFWSCEVEGGDLKQWDYCCRPHHSCGYSRGFNYPWCYVGEASPDQWRPCSEQYYPSSRPYTNRDERYRPATAKPWYSQEDLGPPSYWPISYLYTEPPPNETDYQFSESPRIKFKDDPPKASYPKAIVQKLDLQNNPSVTPSEASETENITAIRENFAKKLQMIDKVEDEDLKFVLLNTGGSKTKNEASPLLSELSAVEIVSKVMGTNKTNCDDERVKEVIKSVEKLIEEEVTAMNKTEVQRPNRSAKKYREMSAMDRFWTWGREKYA